MGGKQRYRRQRPRAKWRKPSVPRPKNLDETWQHVSALPGYLVERINITFDLLKDHDVPTEFVDALEQEFAIKITLPQKCGIDGRDDRRLAAEAKKRRLIVLTRNHTDFFAGALIPLNTCPGIFAIDGSYKVTAIVANMGAVLRELGPHLQWDWWKQTKIKFGPKECNLRRHENGRIVRRRLTIDNSGRVWFQIMRE
jgi:hypothetical protein